MKKLLKLLLLAALGCFLGAATTFAQDKGGQEPKKDEKKEEKSAFVGKWDVIIAAPGEDMTGTITLSKEGDTHSGTVTTALGDALLSNIKIDGMKLNAGISVNVQGHQMEGTFTAAVEGDSIKGEVNLPGFPPISYSGKKK
jgi:hypothetical protein